MFDEFIKNVKKNDIFTLFEIVVNNNVNMNFSILTRELLLIF